MTLRADGYIPLGMRAILQRVTSASVAIAEQPGASIQAGLVVFVGIETTDTLEDVRWVAAKIMKLRIFADDSGAMKNNVFEINGNVLLISQFTLFASTAKGSKPSWHRAAKPEVAVPLYESMITELGLLLGHPIATGRFGAMMSISLVNDGPVTLLLDSKRRE